ncbi:spore germination protein [Bacillus sp. 2205SS5-2]|uniref:spore germination protein n=1 Tax=Bacillus sp. 2205SS5-2 TaxID=3109031 RepID=UPI003005943E
MREHRDKDLKQKNSSSEQIRLAKLSLNLAENKCAIQNIFIDCYDIKYQSYQFSKDYSIHALSVFCDTIVQKEKANLLKGVLQDLVTSEVGPATEIDLECVKTFFMKNGVSFRSVNIVNTLGDISEKVLEGHVIILFDHWNKALTIDAYEVDKRPVGEPQYEVSILGPREGTNENLSTNLGLIRSRLKTSNLKIHAKVIGNETKSKVVYAYLNGTVPRDTLKQFRERFLQINNEELFDTSYLAELMEDSTYSPFPQYRSTERPDVAVANLYEGKIILLMEGSPTIIICPGLFIEFFQTPSDYYERTVFSSLIRMLRICGYLISLTLPAIYIALSTFHTELIPTVLLLAILDTREGIPFPSLVEALIMIFFFELLQEAGLRLPKPIGSAVSIVGAIIIGEASINAGIASPIMVVVIALTGIASFTIPQYSMGTSARLLRIPLMLIASILGGFGLMIGFILIYLHLICLRSLGQPYMATIDPMRPDIIYEFFTRAPLKFQIKKQENTHIKSKQE